MNPEEQLILEFLRSAPESFFSRREIARKAVKRTEYEQNRNWADQPLAALVGRKLVELDGGGAYRLRPGSAR